MTHPSEVDAVTHEFTQIAVKALRAARQIMVARQHQTQLAQQAAQNVAAGAQRAAQQADLARHWRAEALAARWAAAEAMRERDPRTADAWSERLADSGVDTRTLTNDGGLARVEGDVAEATVAEASVVVADIWPVSTSTRPSTPPPRCQPRPHQRAPRCPRSSPTPTAPMPRRRASRT